MTYDIGGRWNVQRTAQRGKVDGGNRQRAVHIKDPVRALCKVDVHGICLS